MTIYLHNSSKQIVRYNKKHSNSEPLGKNVCFSMEIKSDGVCEHLSDDFHQPDFNGCKLLYKFPISIKKRSVDCCVLFFRAVLHIFIMASHYNEHVFQFIQESGGPPVSSGRGIHHQRRPGGN